VVTKKGKPRHSANIPGSNGKTIVISNAICPKTKYFIQMMALRSICSSKGPFGQCKQSLEQITLLTI